MMDHKFLEAVIRALEGNLADLGQIELLIEKTVAAAPNLLIVARALRTALQDDWERAELAALLTEEH